MCAWDAHYTHTTLGCVHGMHITHTPLLDVCTGWFTPSLSLQSPPAVSLASSSSPPPWTASPSLPVAHVHTQHSYQDSTAREASRHPHMELKAPCTHTRTGTHGSLLNPVHTQITYVAHHVTIAIQYVYMCHITATGAHECTPTPYQHAYTSTHMYSSPPPHLTVVPYGKAEPDTGRTGSNNTQLSFWLLFQLLKTRVALIQQFYSILQH